MKNQYEGNIDEEKDLCRFCGKKPVRIHLEGVGDFCNDCYNRRELERRGIPDTFKYKESVTVTDADG